MPVTSASSAVLVVPAVVIHSVSEPPPPTTVSAAVNPTRREQERIVAVAAGERFVAAGGAVKSERGAVGDAAGVDRIVAGAARDGEISNAGAGHEAVGQRHIVGAVGKHQPFDARDVGKCRRAQRPGGGDEQIVEAPAPPCTVSALVRSEAANT